MKIDTSLSYRQNQYEISYQIFYVGFVPLLSYGGNRLVSALLFDYDDLTTLYNFIKYTDWFMSIMCKVIKR